LVSFFGDLSPIGVTSSREMMIGDSVREINRGHRNLEIAASLRSSR
jgi:hypothetical protein